MSFTDGKTWVVTKKQTQLHWGGGGLYCLLCNHDFQEGEEVSLAGGGGGFSSLTLEGGSGERDSS